MNYDEAKVQLQFHSGMLDATGDVGTQNVGFLVGLRPYQGLQEKHLHLVMEALLTVGERIYREPLIDRELMNTIWSLCWYARTEEVRAGLRQAIRSIEDAA